MAGPVINNRIHATNLPWIVDAEILAQEVGVKSIVLVNDLGATGHSLAHLPPEDFCVLNVGTPVPGCVARFAGRRYGTWAKVFCSGMASATKWCPAKAVIPIMRRAPISRSNC